MARRGRRLALRPRRATRRVAELLPTLGLTAALASAGDADRARRAALRQHDAAQCRDRLGRRRAVPALRAAAARLEGDLPVRRPAAARVRRRRAQLRAVLCAADGRVRGALGAAAPAAGDRPAAGAAGEYERPQPDPRGGSRSLLAARHAARARARGAAVAARRDRRHGDRDRGRLLRRRAAAPARRPAVDRARNPRHPRRLQRAARRVLPVALALSGRPARRRLAGRDPRNAAAARASRSGSWPSAVPHCSASSWRCTAATSATPVSCGWR